MKSKLGLRVVIALLLVGDAALLYFGLMEFDEQAATTIAIAWGGTIVLCALMMILRPHVLLVGLVQGIAVAVIATVALLWAVMLAFSHFEASNPGAIMRDSILLFGGLVAAQVAILAATYALEGSITHGVVSTLAGAAGAYILFLAIAFISYVATPFIDLAMMMPRFAADSIMTASVARVQACAYKYAAQYPDRGYPSTLAALGPSGTKCLDKRTAAGKNGRVQVTYAATRDAESARLSNFTVVAHASSAGSDGVPKMAFGDASGFLRAGPATDVPSKLPIIHGTLHTLSALRACAEVYRATQPDSSYPRAVTDIDSLKRAYDSEGILSRVGCTNAYFPPPGKIYDRQTTRLAYTPSTNDGPVNDYVVEMRPGVYGVTGIRSYRATAHGPVHVTLEDRAATEEDPVVPACEYELGDQLCAPLPRGHAPLASIAADSSVTRGVPFQVVVQDLRAADAVDAPYQAWIQCNHKPYSDAKPNPAYSFTFEHACTIAENEQTQWSDRALVRAFVRNRAGSVAILLDTVYFVKEDAPGH